MAREITLTTGPDLWPQEDSLVNEAVSLSALEGNDTITGTSFDDLILGNPGRDLLNGGAGNDTVYGGKDNDTINASGGDNLLLGNLGDDLILALVGNNIIYGGQNNDSISGGTGNNQIFGNLGNDGLVSGNGSDYIHGGQGDDTILANRSEFGTGGNDTLLGGKGNDSIVGGSGNSTLYGNEGNDTITPGTADTYVDAGEGNDLIFVRSTGVDTLIGGLGDDIFEVGAEGIGPNTIIYGELQTGGQVLSEINLSSEGLISEGILADGDFRNILRFRATTTVPDSVRKFDIEEIDLQNGVTVTAPISFVEGVTRFSGTGTVVLDGTPEEVQAFVDGLPAGSSPDIVFELPDGTVITPVFPVSINSTQFPGVPAGDSVYVIDVTGSQLPAGTVPSNVVSVIGGLGVQFGEIAAGSDPLVNPQRQALINFGNLINDAQYIAQISQAQYNQGLANEFYRIITNNGVTPVETRFLSVKDGTNTTLYYDAAGQFGPIVGAGNTVADQVVTTLTGQNAFIPSNIGTNLDLPGQTGGTLIPASTQIVVI
ncbi:alkaline phosphatase [Geminocystis sp. NIES-3708]|uniref:calcium-binding protein n=1 Tax=Geminocystis sp. NIES-3708 TaxID=1615909 RepID=UPI0005FCB542|nr:calcium-binding protein [Geminocystis sp. NIES-3708]BAQ61650.1 alkaline phosphatase [Geminocystis sp. NIES-3708]